MSHDPATDGGTEEAAETAADSGARRSSTGGTGRRSGGDVLPAADTVADSLQWGALAAFVLLGIVAGFGLYTSAGRVIEVWVAGRYQPVVRTVFNAALLLVAAAGVSAVLGRLERDS